jgi:hypothetical protein
MYFICVVIFLFLILDVQRVDVIIETSEESQDRHLGQDGITMNNSPTKEKVILGHVFHLSFNNISNLIVKNAGSVGVKSKELNVCQNTHLSSRTEGKHVCDKPYQCNQCGKIFWLEVIPHHS